jgi:pectate lyase
MLSGTTDRRTHTRDHYWRHWHHRFTGFTSTDGGAGGTVVKVTNLNTSGAGSLVEALSANNRIIVFEVGGAIDFSNTTVTISNRSNITIAGQTAPPPGIKILRGKLDLNNCNNWIISHLDMFAGEGLNTDCFETRGNSYDIIVDHCSFFWGDDETASISGYPTDSSPYEDLIATISRRVTFSQCVVAEGVGANRGTIVTDGCTDIFLWANYWCHCTERTPTFKSGSTGVVANCLSYNNQKFLESTQQPSWWYDLGYTTNPQPTGKLVAVGNAHKGGPSYSTPTTLLWTTRVNEHSGIFASVDFYHSDNDIRTSANAVVSDVTEEGTAPFNGHTASIQGSAPLWPSGFTAFPSSDVPAIINNHVGARPWNRDAHVTRVLGHYANGTGAVVANVAAAGGFGTYGTPTKSFVDADWELDTMIPKRKAALVA